MGTRGLRVNATRIINETIEGEVVMIDLVSGNYYTLDDVGTEIWALLERGCSRDAIVAAIEERYEGERATIEESVGGFLDDLERDELILQSDVDESTSPRPALNGPGEGAPFRPPKLEKYTDMQDLILLDPVHEVGERGWPYTSSESKAAGA
jgi:Coenzyme PQQ synthesis protein D (PqqD)